MRLISSRTKLRDSLKNYEDSPSEELRMTMQKILRDAQSAVDMVTRVALYGADNNLVTSSGDGDAPLQQVIQPTRGEVQFGNFHARNDGGLDARILARMELNTEHIGSLEIVANTDSLSVIAGNYTGLGSSGEFESAASRKPQMVQTVSISGVSPSKQCQSLVVVDSFRRLSVGLHDPADMVLRTSLAWFSCCALRLPLTTSGSLSAHLTTRFRPLVFAAYNALSARFNRSVVVS